MKMVTLDTIGLTAFGYDFGCCEKLEYVSTFYDVTQSSRRALVCPCARLIYFFSLVCPCGHVPVWPSSGTPQWLRNNPLTPLNTLLTPLGPLPRYSPVAGAFEYLLKDLSLRSQGANLVSPAMQLISLPTKRNKEAHAARTLLRSTLAGIIQRKEAAMAGGAGGEGEEGGEGHHKDMLYYLIDQRDSAKLKEEVRF